MGNNSFGAEGGGQHSLLNLVVVLAQLILPVVFKLNQGYQENKIDDNFKPDDNYKPDDKNKPDDHIIFGNNFNYENSDSEHSHNNGRRGPKGATGPIGATGTAGNLGVLSATQSATAVMLPLNFKVPVLSLLVTPTVNQADRKSVV